MPSVAVVDTHGQLAMAVAYHNRDVILSTAITRVVRASGRQGKEDNAREVSPRSQPYNQSYLFCDDDDDDDDDDDERPQLLSERPSS
ncbi:hypothetical protein CYMTET_51080 [Cymbomonas tetramitiformis]|uniref:Uncharacterized protein n=1 Tax=Cymbomonas tetramitiformis TaxID=36881 RepID=A0AAE0BND4_9CHLO|nr:hypothetical protein CYMTET_51080 [Cymbomonas tetramitiformis]